MNFKLNIKNNTIVSNFTSSRFRLSKVKNSTTPKSSLLFVSKKSNMLNVHYTFIFLKCTIPKTNIIFSDSKKYINIQFCNTTFQTLDLICNIYIFQIARPGFHFEVPKNIKLRQKQFHMKYTGKFSSRKLRRVIYYTLYRMDPKKAHYKISCFAKTSKIKKWGAKRIYPPSPNSRSTAP